ncbi:MAG: class I SAM-dependent methyltransferase [Longimicrobiales bacterium]
MSEAGGYDQYEFIADLYDYVCVHRHSDDVAFFAEAASTAGGPVLEVGCGTGRILIPAARAGARMVGLDLSLHMLRVCRERLGRESAEVRSAVQRVHADMRNFTLTERFAFAMLPFRSFQHVLTVDDQIASLGNIRRHLVNGGRMILDVFNPSLEALANQQVGDELGEEPEFATPDGRRVVRRHKIVVRDRINQVNQIELLYYVTHPDGREERLVHAFAMRYLFRFEVEHLLVRCGFQVEQLYAGYDKSEYGSRYPGELVVVARKSA